MVTAVFPKEFNYLTNWKQLMLLTRATTQEVVSDPVMGDEDSGSDFGEEMSSTV